MLRDALNFFRAAVSTYETIGPDYDVEAADEVSKELKSITEQFRPATVFDIQYKVRRAKLPWIAIWDARLRGPLRKTLHVEYVGEPKTGALSLMLGFGGVGFSNEAGKVISDLREHLKPSLTAFSAIPLVPTPIGGLPTQYSQYLASAIAMRTYGEDLPSNHSLVVDLTAMLEGLVDYVGDERIYENLRLEDVRSDISDSRPASGKVASRSPIVESNIATAVIPSRKYPVWFCTNRMPLVMGNRITNFDNKRDPTAIHHGKCEIVIPKGYETGPVNRNWLEKLICTDSNRFHVESIKTFSIAEFFSTIQMSDKEEDNHDRLLLYVHGFNTTFFDAVARAGQLGFDLKYPGRTAAFSWAQNTGFSQKNYLGDWTNGQIASAVLNKFLINLVSKSKIKWIDVIAHSMGSRILVAGLDTLPQIIKHALRHIILAAADIQTEAFNLVYKPLALSGKSRTLYISKSDKALSKAESYDGKHRIGRCPPVVVVNGVDTVQIPLDDWLTIGHSYFSEGHAVITDMHQIVHNDAPPEKRSFLTSQLTNERKKYWLMRVAA